MSTKVNIKKKAMIKALEANLGVVTASCMQVGVARTLHYRWMNEDENYRRQVEDIENVAIDFAESKLFTNIRNNDSTCTIFYLKTKGKKRGYVEKQEVDMHANLNVSNSIPIEDFIKARFKE
jgi:hypothetical protein